MDDESLLPLAMLYVDREREIDGVTRLQKLIFLAQKEGGLGDIFDFEEHKYGPFSKELYFELDQLEVEGLVDREVKRTRGGNERYVYNINLAGRERVRAELSEESDNAKNVLDAAQEIKRKFNEEPLERLLQYVYNKYPEYTGESELVSEDGEIEMDRPTS